MNISLSLKNKNDEILIFDLKELVAKERQILTDILHYLREVEVRKLYLKRGYSSLWAFCTEELGYSESAAQRRIQAMRLLKEIPEVEDKIESGKLSLSVASQLQGFLRKTEKKSREEEGPEISRAEKISLINQLEGTSARQCERKLAEIAPEISLPKEKTKPLNETEVMIQFVAGKKLMKKIQKAKELLSHQNLEGRYDELFEKVLDIALAKLDPAQREARRQKRLEKSIAKSKSNTALGCKKIKAKANSKNPGGSVPKAQGKLKNPFKPSLATSAVKRRSRQIPQAMRDKIWLRDQGCCQHFDRQTGKLCGSRHVVQLDHRFPFALGGEHSEDNLQLRCFNHNQRRSEDLFGGRSGDQV